MPRIEKGKRVHCFETVTGQNLTGTILISEEELRSDLYSYTEFFHIKTEEPIHLIAQTGEVISFHACIESGSGSSHHYDRTVYHQGVIANIAIVGADPWGVDDKVRKVSFRVKNSMELLRHHEKLKAIGSAGISAALDLSLFQDRANGMTLRAGYTGSWGMDFDGPTELWPAFEIEFDEPQGVHEYIEYVSDYVRFLSFCLGVPLKPSDIRIDRNSELEISAQVEAHTYRGSHDVHYVWEEANIDASDLWIGGSPACAWDDEELKSFRTCLVAWMDRASAWRNASIMMMTSLALGGVISAERLINACRWLDEIPSATSQIALSKADIDQIASAAASKAVELGHAAAIRERIQASIARIKEESAAERFSRLVAMLRARFGEDILPNNVVEHLRRAVYFRGRTAHGHFNPYSDGEERAFYKSMRAMEALCYLMMTLDLPMLPEGAKRLGSSRLLRDYRRAYE